MLAGRNWWYERVNPRDRALQGSQGPAGDAARARIAATERMPWSVMLGFTLGFIAAGGYLVAAIGCLLHTLGVF